MENYKATPEQWEKCEADAKNWSGSFECILELRARVEQLEADAKADQRETFPTLDRALRNSDKLDRLIAQDRDDAPAPTDSLVERVRKALSYPPEPYARAAIREVTAWLVEEFSEDDGCINSQISFVIAELRQEAER